MPTEPAGFLSYVQLNDKHDSGRLTQLRERLEYEVQVHTGQPFPIFQDRNDIKWGQQWKKRIEEGIDASTFLVAIITPSYLKSPACRDEFELFLAREKKLKRSDLILPLVYVDTPQLVDKRAQSADKIVKELASRQWADWRDLRHEPWTTPAVGKRLESIAIQIRDAMDRSGRVDSKGAAKSSRKKVTRLTYANIVLLPDPVIERPEAAPMSNQAVPNGQAEARIISVDSAPDRANYRTITEAIASATGGERILVRPGVYKESLVIDKPLEIIGDGPREEIIVECDSGNTLRATSGFCRISNLSLRHTANKGWRCVDLTQGWMHLEDCEIWSSDKVSLGVRGTADPIIRRCVIYGGSRCAIYVSEEAKGTFEDNDICGPVGTGVEIWGKGDPIIRRNRIHGFSETGLLVHSDGRGTIEDNEIFGNKEMGIAIAKGGDPICRRNRIHDNNTCGISISTDSKGTFESNDISVNANGVMVRLRSNPTFKENRIYANEQIGIIVHEGGQGIYEGNHVFSNLVGVAIVGSVKPAFLRNQITKNRTFGVHLSGTGGIFEGNDLRKNTLGPWKGKDKVDMSSWKENVDR